MRFTLLLSGLLAALTAPAQTRVHQTTFTFSDGAHPTFMVEFEDADVGDVESWYRSQLKDISKDVESKKEIRATGARVPAISPDTITVLCKAEKPRKGLPVALHLAFMVNGGWVAGASDKRQAEAAHDFAYTKAVAFKKHVLQLKLEEAEKTLGRHQAELATLEKDHRRYEDGITRNREKGTEAAADKVQEEGRLQANEQAVRTKQAELAGAASGAAAEELQDLLKEQDRLKDRIERLGNDVRNAEEHVKDLEYAIQKNLEDQEAKRATIEKQTAVVEELRTAVASVN